jgi:thiol-disulfide isomerase/thioredoxin
MKENRQTMGNFKILFTLICVSSLFFSFTNKGQTTKTVIFGIIKTEGTANTLKKISLQFPDYISSTAEVMVPVDSLGCFHTELYLSHPTDFSIKFRKNLKFFVSPGDSIYLEIDKGILNVGNLKLSKLYSYINITGTAPKACRDVAQFNACLMDSLTDWDLEEYSTINLNPGQYKDFIASKKTRQEVFLKEFNAKRQTNNEFQEWAKYHLQFGIWYNLFQYVRDHPEYTKTDKILFYNSLPNNYFDFLKEWDMKNKRAEISSNFFSFINDFHHKIGLDCSSGMDERNSNFLENYFPRFEERTNQLHAQYVKDILFAQFYAGLLKTKNFQFLSSIYQPDLIQDQYLNTRIQELYDKEKLIVENSALSSESKLKIINGKNVINFLDTLISRHKGKVIFIDFWGSWCAPCIKELPFSKVLYEALKGQDIVFVYLAVRSNENAWKQAIAQNNIGGEHYLLNKEQEAYLLEKFSFSEFPHYALIGKDGLIYKKSTFAPSQKPELTKEINYLLAKDK